MSFSLSKANGSLQFKDFGGYETRNSSTIWCIKKADEIYKWGDFDEIKIYTGDYEDKTDQYTYSKRNSYNRLVPDFNFHCWPQVGINDYEHLINEISTVGLDSFKINKVGWIGNTNDIRIKMLEIGRNNKELFDLHDMKWLKSNNLFLNSSKYISLTDLVKTYSILIDIEGNGYSGRVKFLLWSRRPLLLVDRPHKEYFFEYLKEWIHYVPVKRDLSDLVEKTRWCLENYEKARQIAINAYIFSMKYLTREACFNQWDKIIKTIPKE